MTVNPYQHLPPPPPVFNNFSEVATYLRRMYDALYRLRQGKSENIIELTLTANAATTTITDIRLSGQSVLTFDPKTANAAAELAAGTLYPSTRGNGEWIITHANNAQTDRDFQVSIVG